MEHSNRDGLVPMEAAEDCWQLLPQMPLPGDFADVGAARPAEERMSRLITMLEAEIIPRLVDAHRQARPAAAAGTVAEAPGVAEVEAFASLVLGNDDAAAAGTVAALQARGVPVATIFTALLAPAARRLGWMWEEDLCDFTDVTVGVGRLQQLMRELSPAFGSDAEVPADGRRVLLMAARGEQHTFGLSMVGEFFRRDGWEVVGGTGIDGDPVAMVRGAWFDLFGLSVGHHTRSRWARDTIAAIRQHSRNRAIGIMVGGPLFVVDGVAASAVGADLSVLDGASAPALAGRLLDRRARSG